MIISASRRTDIPSYYSECFFNRLKERYVLVRNPINIHQVSKIDLSPDVVDCIVFWTKNPSPMLDKLGNLNDYNYYFQFTLNSYGKDIEPNVPSKNDKLIDVFKKLSDRIGPERVVWRYDPILINKKYTIDYHIKYFGTIAKHLSNYTEKCTISFLDFFPKIKSNINRYKITSISDNEKRLIAKELSSIAFSYGLIMDTCAEGIELGNMGISNARCIDDRLISRITGAKINVDKDKNQRQECGCVSSIDIGLYNTCLNSCKYCYANYSQNTVKKNASLYDKNSPLLCSKLDDKDKIYVRKVESLKDNQMSFLLE